jgi:uncharacterized membrane protein
MESRAKFLGHPLHQQLIVFPLGLLATSVLFDIAGALVKNAELFRVSYYMIGAGVISGLIAAVPGMLDWLAIPTGTRAKAVGLLHAIGNVVVLTLFGLSWFIRREAAPADPGAGAIVLSFLAFALAGFTGWLGGELVDRLGVGVDNGAHLNSPSSLSNRPASEDVAGTTETTTVA